MKNDPRSRIAYFSDASYSGGAEKYLHLLASGIDRERFIPVSVVCNVSPGNRLPEWMAGSKIETFYVDWKPELSLMGMKSLYRILKDISADILHINLPGPFDSRFSLAAPVAKHAGIVGVVSTEHLPMFPSFPKARILKGFATRYIDSIITVSENNRAYLVKEHHVPDAKIKTIYNGVPPDSDGKVEVPFKGGGLTGDVLRLLIAGSIEERKGHAILIEALKEMPSDVVLTVVGEGPARGAVEELARKTGVADRVIFTGFRDNIMPLLRGSDLLVVPSFIEATPYVIMEAFSASLPVVASDIFGIPELVTEGVTGSLARAGDVSGFIAAIMRYHADRSLLAATSERCEKEYRNRFTLERSVGETSQVYEGILSVRRKGGSR